jgi:cystathionine beta-synthase
MAEDNYDRRYTTTPCKWSLHTTEPSPHTKEDHRPRPKICQNVLEAIGHTPIVKINNITKQENISCELLVKCEFMNPGGSVKDRPGARIIEDLERSGQLRPGMRLAEPTSGNTGIGLAMAAIVKGYELTCALPERMSQEKADILTGLGVKIIRTPSEAKFNAPESHLGVCVAMTKKDPNVVLAGQHIRAYNPLAHYDHTAEEIFDQLDGKLDYLVVSVGTGGQVTGLSRKLKEKIPGLTVVGVDVEGSTIYDPENAKPFVYKTEGPGNNSIVPRACNTDLVDKWFVSSDHNAFHTARRIIRHEGLLVGGSAGSVVWAAVELCKTLPADKRVLCMLPDGIKNYLTKFLSDRWMVQNGFMKETETEPVAGKTLRDLHLNPVPVCQTGISIRQLISFMKENKLTDVPVLNEGNIVGVASSATINKKVIEMGLGLDEDIMKVVTKGVKVFDLNANLAFINVWVQDLKYALVKDGDFISLVYSLDLTLGLID